MNKRLKPPLPRVVVLAPRPTLKAIEPLLLAGEWDALYAAESESALPLIRRLEQRVLNEAKSGNLFPIEVARIQIGMADRILRQIRPIVKKHRVGA